MIKILVAVYQILVCISATLDPLPDFSKEAPNGEDNVRRITEKIAR